MGVYYYDLQLSQLVHGKLTQLVGNFSKISYIS